MPKDFPKASPPNTVMSWLGFHQMNLRGHKCSVCTVGDAEFKHLVNVTSARALLYKGVFSLIINQQ